MTTTHQSPLVEGPHATYEDIDLMGSSNGELQDLTNRLVDRATTYGKEASTVKGKILTNSTNNISTRISMNGQKLEEVTSFKYLGATLCKDDTCSAEVRIRLASAMAAMARRNSICQCSTISFASKFKLYKSFVTSIFLYGCETWNLTVDSEKKIQASETKCMRKLLCICYLERKTNDWVRNKINFLVGPRELSSGNCQETETCMVRACHTPRQSL